MIKKSTLFLAALTLFACLVSNAQYTSPGLNKGWNMDSLVVHAPAVVSFDGTAYIINNDITISETDTLKFLQPVTVKTASGKRININGVIISDPAEGKVVFTAVDTTTSATYFKGFRIEDSNHSYFRNTVVMHGGGIGLIESDMLFEYCVFRNNGHSNVSAAINYSSCSPTVRYCEFRKNSRSAMASASNMSGSAQILYNTIVHNVTENSNRPQLNLTRSAEDTIRIIGNYIEGMYPVSGGISISTLVGGSAKVLVADNTIVGNRYGYTQIGGNISSVIKNNVILNNNLETNPMNGGSGLNFLSSAGEGNVSIVRNNLISGNLWGVTIQGIANPDLGILNSPGMNYIFDNGNNGQVYDLYNNTALPVNALYNYWGTHDADEMEVNIVHQPDNASLGLVNYVPFLEVHPHILSFAFKASDNQGLASDVFGIIDSENHTVHVVVPFQTDLTSLIPEISIPYRTQISPDSGMPQDFSQAVVYTVTVPHATQEWTVIVEEAEVFAITFEVKDQDNSPLQDAVVTLNGIAQEPGVYLFENLVPGVYSYVVSKEGYLSVEGEVELEDEDVTVDIMLELIKYEVLFVITDGQSGVESAVISIAEQTLTSNESGEASLFLPPGTYAYLIAKEGFLDYTGNVEIIAQDVQVAVLLKGLGLDNISSGKARLFPNPFGNRIVLSSADQLRKVMIYSVSGQLIFDVELEGKSEIDTSSLLQGVYTVVVVDKTGNRYIQKMIK